MCSCQISRSRSIRKNSNKMWHKSHGAIYGIALSCAKMILNLVIGEGVHSMAWNYVIRFLIGGTIFVLMSYFSKSKILFLSGIITFIPIMTLINMGMQIKYMNVKEFRTTEFNGIFGALGAVVLISCVFLLTHWIKPVNAAFISVGVYLAYMVSCKYLL